MLAELKIGAQNLADGSTATASGERTGGQRVADSRGKYADSVSRGNVYNCSDAVAGTAPGTAFSTTPNTLLWNPPNSGKNLELLTCSVGYISGTLGAGMLAYGAVASGNLGTTAVPTGGAERTTRSAMVGLIAGSVGRFFNGSTVTTAGTILRAAFNLGAFLATTAAIVGALKDDIAGEFVVRPQSSFVVEGVAAAGTTPLINVALTWQEVQQ